jgi:hypothetical protein
MEAVKQGSAAVGLKSKQFVVLATLKRAASELSSYQRKLFKIDDHMAIAIAGLTADGRVLSRYMRSECINHQFVYETPMNVGRLVTQVSASNTRRRSTQPMLQDQLRHQDQLALQPPLPAPATASSSVVNRNPSQGGGGGVAHTQGGCRCTSCSSWRASAC